MMTTVAQQPHLDAAYLRSKHEAGLDYESYLATDPAKAANWRKHEQQLRLTDEQRRLISGFTRQMRILVVSGIWCGDCAVQCPMLVKIAQGTSKPNLIDIRFVDRDAHSDLSNQIMINTGHRVPTVIFMAE